MNSKIGAILKHLKQITLQADDVNIVGGYIQALERTIGCTRDYLSDDDVENRIDLDDALEDLKEKYGV